MSLDIRLPILLRQMRLPTVAANYRKFAQEAARTGQPYEEYLLALLEHEANQRDINRRTRRVHEARFPVKRTLDEFDFAALPSLKRNKVLDLAKGEVGLLVLDEIKDGDFSSLSPDDQQKVRQELDRIIGGAEVNAFTDELKNRAEITIPEQSN